MPEELETILRLVAEGTLTPEEAAPIIDALTFAARVGARVTTGALPARRVTRPASTSILPGPRRVRRRPWRAGWPHRAGPASSASG